MTLADHETTAGEATAVDTTQTQGASEEVLDAWASPKTWDAHAEATTQADAPANGSEASAGTTAPEVTSEATTTTDAGAAETAGNTNAEVWTPTPSEIHALERTGYSLDDLKYLPDKGRALAERFKKSLDEQSARWAQLGVEKSRQQQTPPAPPAPQAEKPDRLKQLGIDPAVWGEEGAKAIPDVLDKALAPHIEEIKQLKSELQKRNAQAVAQEGESFLRQVTDIFDGHAAEYPAYGNVKGDHTKLTPEQRNVRQKVAELAGHIAAGAVLDGKPLPLDVALSQAHAMVSADYRVKNERQQIASQVRDRQGQFISRPAPGNRVGVAAAVPTKSDIEAKVGREFEEGFANIR